MHLLYLCLFIHHAPNTRMNNLLDHKPDSDSVCFGWHLNTSLFPLSLAPQTGVCASVLHEGAVEWRYVISPAALWLAADSHPTQLWLFCAEEAPVPAMSCVLWNGAELFVFSSNDDVNEIWVFTHRRRRRLQIKVNTSFFKLTVSILQHCVLSLHLWSKYIHFFFSFSCSFKVPNAQIRGPLLELLLCTKCWD